MFQSSGWFRHFPSSALTHTENILLWVSRTTGARAWVQVLLLLILARNPAFSIKAKLSKPPAPSATPAGRCFLFLSFLSQYGTTCQVQCLNTKRSLFLQRTEGWGIRQVKFCGLQSEFLDYILIKKLLLTDASGTAYAENKEAHFCLLIASVLCHCQRSQLWARWQTEILGSPEQTHRHPGAVSALSTTGSLPHQPCPCSTPTQSRGVTQGDTKAHC